MKKHLVLILALLTLLCVCAIVVSAHSGGTDENGGHYDYSTGEYHYHHGYSAHEHVDGECVFDFEDNVDHDRGDNNSSASDKQSNSNTKKTPWFGYVILLLLFSPMAIAPFYILPNSIREYKQNPTRKNLGNLLFFIFLSLCSLVSFASPFVFIFCG